MCKHGLIAASLLAGVAAAQVNPFLVYPQDPERQTVTCTSFVGRPDWNRAAEALMVIDANDFRGVGDANGIVRVFGVYHWVADERLSTIETYDVVLRGPTPTGEPDMTPAGAFLRIQGLTTPPSQQSTRGTWIMYDGFGIPGGHIIFQPPPQLFVGVGLPANALWPNTDGHSLFRADMLHANTGATVGENHRTGAPNATWAGLAAAPSFTTPWTYILGPFVTSPNLHVGAVDPLSNRLGAPGSNIGMNGLYPDVRRNPRRDGITVRVTDNLAPFGFAIVGGCLGWRPPFHYFQHSTQLIGLSHIGSTLPGQHPELLCFGPLTTGQRDFTIAMPGAVPPQFTGLDIVVQGIVFDWNLSLGEWTNAQAVHF